MPLEATTNLQDLDDVLQNDLDMTFVEDTRFGISYRRILPPFDLGMYTSNINSLLSGDEAPDELVFPSIEDFSQIDLIDIAADDIKRFIQWRLDQPKLWRPEIVVAVVKDDSSFGMMRMFGIYADLSGFRSESDYHVTKDLAEGVTWLLHKTGAPVAQAEAIARHFSEL